MIMRKIQCPCHMVIDDDHDYGVDDDDVVDNVDDVDGDDDKA